MHFWSHQGLLVMQIAIFAALVVAILFLTWHAARTRRKALEELRRAADDLNARLDQLKLELTGTITQHVKTETERAVVVTQDLDHKINTLMTRFDEIGRRPEKVEIVGEVNVKSDEKKHPKGKSGHK